MVDLERLRHRLRGLTYEEPERTPRRAAVAAVLRPGGPRGPEALFIKRVERAGDPWSGQMAFPGGRHDESDPDLLVTATREAREEVGLDLGGAELLGRLEDIRTHTGDTLVRPFVFVLHEPVVLVPNEEVAEVHWGELVPMARGERDTSVTWSRGELSMRFPGYDLSGRTIWGLTHRMLQRLFEHAR